MIDAVRRQLCTYQQNRDLDALQAYCENHLNTQADALVRGCLLWNLSDVYAMRRDAKSLYTNHLQFATHLQSSAPMYRSWLVSDATQRLTLEQGGFGDVWWCWYEEVNKAYDPLCEAALFHAHRAAFYKSPQIPYSLSCAERVDKRFRVFLEHTRRSEATVFYHLIYTAQHLSHFGDTDVDIVSLCESFIKDLSEPSPKPTYAAGEWGAVNALRPKAWQAQVGITHAVNALLDTGNITQAKTLYQKARKRGLPRNVYIERCI